MKTFKLIAVALLVISSGVQAATFTCPSVIVRDTDEQGNVNQGGSTYPVTFSQVGNVANFVINGRSFDFQMSKVRNDKWKEGDSMQMETGKIDTGTASSELTVVRENNIPSAVQLEIKSDGKERVITGLDCK